jgi:molybdate transport system ATP-binding protein
MAMLKANFKKKFNAFELQASIEVAKNDLLVILGKSGCGKSTLLNCLAGFISPDSAFFELEGKCYNKTENQFMMPIHKRQIAYIQQGNTLFPHLTVGENILYSVKNKLRDKMNDKYQRLLDLLDINGLINRSVETLSGGQKQRVIIGRALMMDPDLVLWDEPFTALDHQLREELSSLLVLLKKQLNIPMIFVTHDLEEAYKIADTLAIMHEGKILQIGDKSTVFKFPNSQLVAQTVGIKNWISVKCTDPRKGLFRHLQSDHVFEVKHMTGKHQLEQNQVLMLGIRPEHISLNLPLGEKSEKTNTFSATLITKEEKLSYYQLKVKLKGVKELLIMHLSKNHEEENLIVEIGEIMSITIKEKDIIILEKT